MSDRQEISGSASAMGDGIAKDLTWMDTLKGMAIIGVVFDHWVPFFNPAAPSRIYAMMRKVPWGSPVHLFFLLSGFGLLMDYLNKQNNWNWGRWMWRRLTKIIVPYWIAVLYSVLLGLLGLILYSSVDVRSPGRSLIALITFARSLFSPSWAWNVAFWYMPIIVGLYFSFPLLAKILQKKGPLFLFLSSAFLTYGSIAAYAILSGRYAEHSEAWFPFFIVQFAVGMILAFMRAKDPHRLNTLIGLRGISSGIVLCVISWAVYEYLPHGGSYDDLLTTMGIFLIFLNFYWIARSRLLTAVKALSDLGRMSYLIFLVHYPILAFLMGPPVRRSIPPILILPLGLAFIFVMYYLCLLISKPMDRITAWLYNRPRMV